MNGPPVSVVGAGNWGTTLAHLVANNDQSVRLWTNDARQRDEINERRTNERAAPGLTLSRAVESTTDIGDALSGVELVLVAIPSQAFREVARLMGEHLTPEQVVIHGTKGLEIGTHRRMSQILHEETPARQIGVLSGPNIAAEVAAGKPTGTVIASPFPRVVQIGRRALSSTQVMVFAATDVLGVEVAGALKNVVAIAAGIGDEMALGDNAKGFLVTRGLTELMRLAFAMGAEAMTLTGLAGVGDLIVTCQSRLSRNHRIGAALARGERLQEAIARLGMVAEGVYASSSARALARTHDIEMPLFERIDRVLHEGLPPRQALEELMRLTPGRDVPRMARALSGDAGVPGG